MKTNLLKTSIFFVFLCSLIFPALVFSVDHAYVNYRCIAATTSVSTISPFIQIVNDGTTNIRLSDVTVRYWYTIDTNVAQTFNCDSAPFGASNVYGTFVQLSPQAATADYYCQVSFSMGAGILGPGDSSGDIQVRFNKNDWSNFNQANDFSFDPSMINFTPQPKIALYLSGRLLFGTDPVTLVSAPPLSIPAPGTITINIDTDSERSAISPYIYGGNQMWSTFNTETETFWTARRFGGNRATTYNWENNASNAGKEDIEKSDDFWCTALGVPSDQKNVPGIVLTKLHDKSRTYGWYSLITLQMAGYVSKDMNGPVAASEAAPSARWDAVAFNKGSAFSYPPSITDNAVYIDELLNYLVKKYGSASSGAGINGYALDNETELWYDSHPLLHPAKITCDESIQKAIALSNTIKNADPSADVFGPALYGFNGFYSLQDAPDWATTYSQSYAWFVDLYLQKMKNASDAAGKRLLDVFDIHWYPEAKGGGKRITFDPFDANNVACAKARLQAPRALWDPSFIENSWIAQWHLDFMPLIPRLQSSINAAYPGTKLAITEYNYGGDCHVSGGIANADVLGIMGKYGIYFATYWAVHSPQDYASAAFKIYRNYDGAGSAYGNTNVKAGTSDIENSVIYASISASDDSLLHIVALNKNYDNGADFNFKITSQRSYTSARVWGFDSSSSAITERSGVTNIVNNTFTYSVAKLTALHMVLVASGSSSTPEPTPENSPDPTAAPTLSGGSLGDVNHDGYSDVVDSLLIAQYYVGLAPTSFDPANADVTKNGTINIDDALTIARFYVGLITGF